VFSSSNLVKQEMIARCDQFGSFFVAIFCRFTAIVIGFHELQKVMQPQSPWAAKALLSRGGWADSKLTV